MKKKYKVEETRKKSRSENMKGVGVPETGTTETDIKRGGGVVGKVVAKIKADGNPRVKFGEKERR